MDAGLEPDAGMLVAVLGPPAPTRGTDPRAPARFEFVQFFSDDGELPVLLCEPSEGAPPWQALEPLLRAHLEATLPPTSVPVALHPIARLPRGPLGKVLGREALALLSASNDPAGDPR